MAGGKRRQPQDTALKISNGQAVKTGQILCRGINSYKAGINAKGQGTIFALRPGEVYFTKRKTSHGQPRTFINVRPLSK